MTARIKGNILTVDGVKSQLSPQELTILWAVMARPAVSEDEIAEMLWPHPDNQPDSWANVISILVCRLRKKLKPGGWGIERHYKRPFRLVEV